MQALASTRCGRRVAASPARASSIAAPAPAKPQAKTEAPMNLVFVSAEVSPWSKTGGLGDVVGALPIELAARGHHVVSISPRFDQYPGAWDTGVSVRVLGEDVRFFHEHKKGVHRVFVDHPLFLAKVWGKTGSKLYGAASGADFRDNAQRFALFCHAALAFLSCPLPFAPGDGAHTAVVANDWHTALVPVLLKTLAQPAGKLLRTKCALCVHNIAFQGRFWPEVLPTLGLPASAYPAFTFSDGVPQVFTEDAPAGEDGSATSVAPAGSSFEKINWLRAGVMYADKRLTVSPNYAKEVLSGEDKGVELHGVIAAAGGMEGIVNGMDVVEWDPMNDKHLPVPYDATSVAAGKAAAKQTLQAEVGLRMDADAPLYGYIGRLEEQKGVDILLAAIPGILAAVQNAQVVVLGTGKKSLEAAAKALDGAPSSGGRAVGVVQFSEPLAHLITAGCDFLMVPSRFEPCGLIQLHAMRYGTVPIAASTGGLVDTVTEDVTGFLVGTLDADDLTTSDVDALTAAAVRAAASFDSPKHAAMSAACIAQDLSWALPARKWEGVLASMMLGYGGSGSGSSGSGSGNVSERMAAAFAASRAVLTPVAAVAAKAGPPAAVAAAAAAAAAPAPAPVQKAATPPKPPAGSPPLVKSLVPTAAAAAAGVTQKAPPQQRPAAGAAGAAAGAPQPPSSSSSPPPVSKPRAAPQSISEATAATLKAFNAAAAAAASAPPPPPPPPPAAPAAPRAAPAAAAASSSAAAPAVPRATAPPAPAPAAPAPAAAAAPAKAAASTPPAPQSKPVPLASDAPPPAAADAKAAARVAEIERLTRARNVAK